jgi:hypothetical protein
LVHKDFQQLSERMKDWRKARTNPPDPGHSSAPPASSIKPFDRIVIYVDDLDRCRPDHVVHMLEAVHLLLALDLFVVVVAVDSRWLIRALQVHYRELLTAFNGDGDEDGLRSSTAQNYLEKIFQITYALAPMDSSKFKDYVNFLAGGETKPRVHPGSEAQGAKSTGATKAPASQPGAARPTLGARATPPGTPEGTAAPGRAEPGREQGPKAQAPTIGAKVVLPPPHAVRMTDAERTFLWKLGPLLPTPRIAKRMVNVYRLIKASKGVEALEAFDRDSRYQPCLLMLAILFGRPSISLDFFRGIYERCPPFDRPEEKLVEALRRRTAPGATDPVSLQWVSLLRALDQIGIALTVQDCARESHEVARYSLVTGRDWHTWGVEKAA